MGAKHLIVNAEDFGRSGEINRGIIKAHSEGIVTSTTLAVQGVAVEEALRLGQENPKLSLGLSFVFSAGQPLLPPGDVPSLVDASGSFHSRSEALAAAHLDDVLAEARAQLGRFRELAKARPSHLDTYQGVHALPVFLEALLCLSWETGLGFHGLSPEMLEHLRYERIPAPDHFIDTFSGPNPSLERLAEALADVPVGTTELQCRPALPAERATPDHLSRSQELEILTSVEARQALQAAGIRLVPYSPGG